MAEVKIAKAYREGIRISPRKISIVLDLIRNKDTKLARAILKNTPKSASPYLVKMLDEAVANAQNNFNMDPEKLYVCECNVTAGRTMKRMMPRAQGRGFRILKRSSHVTIKVAEKE